MINQRQVQKYRKEGFLVVDSFLDQAEIDRLRKRIDTILSDFDMEAISIFSTTEQTRTADRYFINSGDKIRCFFEQDAFNHQGELQKAKKDAINKVGHALHDLDPVYQAVSYKPEIAQAAKAIGFHDPTIVQSQYIFKQPKIGGKVTAHQDSSFIFTTPPTCTGFWMALEDATVENGCLMAIPGSHQFPLGSRRFVRTLDGNSTQFTPGKDPSWDLEDMVPLEVKSGTLIILHGSLVHMSLENRSAKSRHAYILHMVESQAYWPPDNWLQRPADKPFRKLYDVVEVQ